MDWTSLTVSISRVLISGARARETVLCSDSPTANSRWMTWSCRSRAMRSRSETTSSSRMRRWVAAICNASAA
ncbi:Uncharacterised protein [Mycobacteroides abscessus subsp. abscessus]|nr:Uncharacterised protein [Mycobacteroides abscessus subsp. abscessus]